jgi:hypothetical protein
MKILPTSIIVIAGINFSQSTLSSMEYSVIMQDGRSTLMSQSYVLLPERTGSFATLRMTNAQVKLSLGSAMFSAFMVGQAHHER